MYPGYGYPPQSQAYGYVPPVARSLLVGSGPVAPAAVSLSSTRMAYEAYFLPTATPRQPRSYPGFATPQVVCITATCAFPYQHLCG